MKFAYMPDTHFGVNLDWICLHIRTPRAAQGDSPSKAECFEAIDVA